MKKTDLEMEKILKDVLSLLNKYDLENKEALEILGVLVVHLLEHAPGRYADGWIKITQKILRDRRKDK